MVVTPVVAGGPCDALRAGSGETSTYRSSYVSDTVLFKKNFMQLVVYSFASIPSNGM